MTKKTIVNQALLLEALERYGADSARWPADTRARLEALVAKDPAARSVTHEFAALDELITSAGTVTAGQAGGHHDALADKIMQSVEQTARVPRRDDTVVPFEAARQRRRLAPAKTVSRIWPDVAAVSALAASLLLGISIGATGVANTTLAPVSEVLGLGPIATETVALSDPIFDSVDDGSFDDDVL